MKEPVSDLKVVMVCGDYPPLLSGVGDYTARLAEAVSQKEVKVTLATTRASDAGESVTDHGVEIRRIMHRWSMSEVGKITSLIDKEGPGTVVHIQYDCPRTYLRSPMVNLLPVILRAKRPQTPVVVTLHGFHEHRLRWRFRALPLLLGADALILVNRRDHQMVTRWIRPERFQTVLIPISSNIPFVPEEPGRIEKVRSQLGFEHEDVVIAFFGFIRPGKGFMNLLDALREIHADSSFLRLLLIGGFDYIVGTGEGYARKAREALKSDHMKDWVVLAEAKEPEKVSRLLQSADLAVFPFALGASEDRGSLLAAIAHGMPVVSTRGPSTPETFEEDFGVMTVPANNTGELAKCIRTLVQSGRAREDLSRRTKAVRHLLSWDKIADSAISVYQSLL